MLIGTLEVKLDAPWVHSLKEKRMVVKSVLAKLRNRFNVSAAEISAQDVHQTIVIGIAYVAQTAALADSTAEHLISFLEGATEAEILEIHREIR